MGNLVSATFTPRNKPRRSLKHKYQGTTVQLNEWTDGTVTTEVSVDSTYESVVDNNNGRKKDDVQEQGGTTVVQRRTTRLNSAYTFGRIVAVGIYNNQSNAWEKSVGIIVYNSINNEPIPRPNNPDEYTMPHYPYEAVELAQQMTYNYDRELKRDVKKGASIIDVLFMMIPFFGYVAGLSRDMSHNLAAEFDIHLPYVVQNENVIVTRIK